MVGHKTQSRQSTPTNTSSTVAVHSKINHVATATLLRDSNAGFKEGNLAYSPLSLEAVLCMVASGSKAQTLNELLDFLGFKSLDQLHSNSLALKLLSQLNSSSRGPIINIANAVWVQKELPVSHSYQEVLNNVYKAQAKSVDFQMQADEVAEEINAWVDKETRGLIQNVANAEDFREVPRAMVLTNALYFKGLWEDEFDPRETSDDRFYLLDGNFVEVPCMRSSASFLYGTLDGFKILEVPYRKGSRRNLQNYSMFIFLPKERGGFKSMIEKFDSDPGLFEMQFDLEKTNLCHLLIPKFKIKYRMTSLQETLRGMGLASFFSLRKELTGIVESPYGDFLFMHRLFQTAVVEVNETGTEAAAYMSDEDMGMGLESPPPPPPSFVADHPFLFMIREKKSNAVLFIGAVLNPKQE